MQMKSIRTALLAVICLGMILSMTACAAGNTDVPEGMKLATAGGDDFRLYVPTVWNENVAYGVSGAYYNMKTQSTVSAVKYPLTEEVETALGDAVGSARLDAYYAWACLPAIETVALEGSVLRVEEETESILLDTLNARRYHAKATVSGSTLHSVHVLAERSGAIYVLTFTLADSVYEQLLSDLNAIVGAFVFAEPYEPVDYARPPAKDSTAPEGMFLVSNDDVAYRFYAPDAWKTNRDEAISAAYLESDRTSVSVVPYMPSVDSMSVGEFFGMCRDAMLETAGEDGFALLSQETVDLGGRQATAYTYTYTVSGTQYYYRQVVAAYKSMIYSMTYTAPSEAAFEAHLDDLDAMIDAFVFR